MALEACLECKRRAKSCPHGAVCIMHWQCALSHAAYSTSKGDNQYCQHDLPQDRIPARIANSRAHSSLCSTAHGVDLGSPVEARRLVMHIFSADFALEWARPLPPNVKYVGPILPQPAQPLHPVLKSQLEVSLHCSRLEGRL